jgi:hypothetical protein
MDPSVTRRTVLVLGAGLGAALAGCSGIGAGGRTATVTPAPLPGVETDPRHVPRVGEPVRLGPVGLAVTDVGRHESAAILGTQVFARPGSELLSLDVALRNAGRGYAALAVDGFDVAVPGALVDAIEPFQESAASDRGGLALLPGELLATRLHFPVPEGVEEARLRATLGVRSLPAPAFGVRETVTVDLAERAEDPVRFDQALTAPVLTVEEEAVHGSLRVRVGEAERVDLSLRDPSPGGEHVAVGLSVRNESERTVVAGVGGLGGMALGDDGGARFVDRVWFGSRLAGGPYYDETRAIGPGEENKGTVVVEVPAGRRPLYLFWTPPYRFWGAGTGVRVNRYVWRLR